MIAYCGLDCAGCNAFKATQTKDSERKKQLVREVGIIYARASGKEELFKIRFHQMRIEQCISIEYSPRRMERTKNTDEDIMMERMLYPASISLVDVIPWNTSFLKIYPSSLGRF